MPKKTIAVIFGGVSSEYEVSLLSASSLLQNIPLNKYDPVMIGITKDGKWLRYTGDPKRLPNDKWLEDKALLTPAFISPDRSIGGLILLNDNSYSVLKIDVIFPVLHGKNGEDGTIQGLFEIAGIPYVGCDVISSAMCMDKAITHTILDKIGIPTAKWEQIYISEMDNYLNVQQRLVSSIGFPMFIKPANAGSSVGVSKVKCIDDLKVALDIAFKEDIKVIAEVAIVGAEVECAVLGNNDAVAASVIGELTPAAEFYDYNAKYISGTTELHIPARVSTEIADLIRTTAVTAYKALGCCGLARVDFFAKSDGSILLNEINTLPGFTSISMYPKMWQASGLNYSDLIDKLIVYGLK